MVGGVILFMVALAFPLILLGIGIIAIAIALVSELFKKRTKVPKGKTVVVWHYKPSDPE